MLLHVVTISFYFQGLECERDKEQEEIELGRESRRKEGSEENRDCKGEELQ